VYLAHLIAVGFIQVAGAGPGRRLIGPPISGALVGVAKFLPFACDSSSFGIIALAAARRPADGDRRAQRRVRPGAGAAGGGGRFALTALCLQFRRELRTLSKDAPPSAVA
jgi:hypothetical protein